MRSPGNQSGERLGNKKTSCMSARESGVDDRKSNEGRERERENGAGNTMYWQKSGHNLCRKDRDFTTNIKAARKGDNGPVRDRRERLVRRFTI